VPLTNVGARNLFPAAYPLVFVVSERNGSHPRTTSGLSVIAGVQTNEAAPIDVPLALATADINQFYSQSACLLSTGLPTGPVTRDANDSYHLPCTMGSIVKLNDTAKPGKDSLVLIDKIEIVGCRCFAPDDPGGDETYLVSNIFWYDDLSKPHLQTMRTNIEADNSVKNDSVIMKGILVNTDPILMPGDEDIHVHIDVWDHESGDADANKNKASEAAQDVLEAGVGAVTALLAGIGAGFAAAVVSKVAGLLSPVGDAIGSIIASFLDDDHIDSKEFLITSDYIRRLVGNADSTGNTGPPVQERTSDSLLDPTLTYNYPELVEDASPEGRSWLFDGGTGGGQYRIFFKITARTVSPPFS
jgi:hypothetical protein